LSKFQSRLGGSQINFQIARPAVEGVDMPILAGLRLQVIF